MGVYVCVCATSELESRVSATVCDRLRETPTVLGRERGREGERARAREGERERGSGREPEGESLREREGESLRERDRGREKEGLADGWREKVRDKISDSVFLICNFERLWQLFLIGGRL